MIESKCLEEKNCRAKKILFQLRDIEGDALRLLRENHDWLDPEKRDLLNEAVGILQTARLELIAEVSEGGCTEIEHWPLFRTEDPCDEYQYDKCQCQCHEEVAGHC